MRENAYRRFSPAQYPVLRISGDFFLFHTRLRSSGVHSIGTLNFRQYRSQLSWSGSERLQNSEFFGGYPPDFGFGSREAKGFQRCALGDDYT